MATIQDFEERIEKQKAELAKLEAKKKELEKEDSRAEPEVALSGHPFRW